MKVCRYCNTERKRFSSDQLCPALLKAARHVWSDGPRIVETSVPIDVLAHRIAEAARAEEREACARVAEESASDLRNLDETSVAEEIARRIRARSTT